MVAITKDFLEEEYLQKDRTAEEIAKVCAKSKSTIFNYLRKFGIKKRVSLVGEEFGLLVVEKQLLSEDGKRMWLCCCECGNEKRLSTHHLRSVKSCGCWNFRHRKKRWNGCGEIHGKYWYNIKRGANSRGHEFDLKIDEAWKMFVEQNCRCALTGVPIVFAETIRGWEKGETTASLDRMDNNIGYCLSNVHWVHKNVNLMKQKMSLDEFLHWCRAVVVYNTNKGE